ncbi:MAG: head GIN domain-containing protein [Sphingobacteriales bacterium]
MKKWFFVFLLAGLAASAQNRIVNDENAVKRDVKSFHGIKVSDGIDLIVTQGNTEAVAVSASEAKYRERIVTEVDNGVLKIYYDHENNWFSNNSDRKKLKAYVSFKELDMLKGSSGADITVDGSVNVNKLDVNLSSGASFTGKVDVKDLSVDQSSGSGSNFTGKVTNLEVETSSGAIFRGYDLASDFCTAKASSGASVRVTVNKELSAKASSGGGIHYKGNGVIRDVDTGSGGSVSRKS